MISHLFPELNAVPNWFLLFMDFFAVFCLIVALPSIVLNIYYKITHIWQTYMPKILLWFKLTKTWILFSISRHKKIQSYSTTPNFTERLTPSDLSELSSLAPPTYPKPSKFPKGQLRGKDGRFKKRDTHRG